MHLIPALRVELDAQTPDVITVVGGGGKTSLVFRLAAEIQAAGKRVVTATTTRVTVGQVERAPSRIEIGGDTLSLDELARRLDESGHCMVVGSETLLNGKQLGVTPGVIDRLAAAAGALDISAILVEGDGSRTLPAKAPAEHEPVVAASTTLLAACLGLDAIGLPLEEGHIHRPERVRTLLGLGDSPARLSPAHAAQLLLHPLGGAKSLPAAARFVPILNKAEGAPRLAAGRLIAGQLAQAGVASLVTTLGAPTGDPVAERWGPAAVVVLAAGEGSRFGGATPKQVALFEGKPLVRRAVRLALESGAEHVVVVTGAHAEETRAALDEISVAAQRLRVVHNSQWAAGQAGSLRVGLDALPEVVQAVIFMPVDQPWLDPALLRRLRQGWSAGSDLVAPTVDGGLRGAPALFDRSTFAELRALRGDQGGRALLQREGATVLGIAAGGAELADADRASDLERGPAGMDPGAAARR